MPETKSCLIPALAPEYLAGGGGFRSASRHRGHVKAKRNYIGFIGNAYLGRLVGHLDHRVMPVGTYILATEPLSEEIARGLIRDDDAVCDSRNIVDYYRLSADRRMLFGGRASYSTLEPRDLFSFMRPRMLAVFPQLAGARLDYCWGGYIAVTLSRLPHIGRIGESLYFAQAIPATGWRWRGSTAS